MACGRSYTSILYALLTWISLEARSLSYSWVSCWQASQCFQKFVYLVNWFFWVKPRREDLMHMRIRARQGRENESAPTCTAKARRGLQGTPEIRLDGIPASPLVLPPQSLQGFAGFVEPDPTLVSGVVRVQRNPCCEPAHRAPCIFAVFSFNIYMTVNDEATVVVVYKLSLLGIWINYPWVEKVRLLKAFFLHSLLWERIIFFGAT